MRGGSSENAVLMGHRETSTKIHGLDVRVQEFSIFLAGEGQYTNEKPTMVITNVIK